MIKNNTEIEFSNYAELFEGYKLSDADIEYYLQLVDEGEIEQAVDEFIKQFVNSPNQVYENNIRDVLLEAEKGELPKQSRSKIVRNIALLTYGLLGLTSKNFAKFINKVVGPSVFKERDITSPEVKAVILENTLDQFQTLQAHTLTNTQSIVLKAVRGIQKEFVVQNQRTAKYTDEEILKETKSFLKKVKKKIPEYDKLKEGRIVISSITDPREKIRFYKLEDYVEMAVRSTILNIDRTSTQISVLKKEEEKAKAKDRVAVNVVEYAVIDNRILRTGVEREICKSILSDTQYGKPLLALDDETAIILGIRTMDEVISTPDYAMGPFCRHGIRPISVAMRKTLEKIIKEYKRGNKNA